MIKITDAQLKEIAATNFGKVYTNPMSSWVIRVAVGGLVTLIGLRLGVTLDDVQTQAWVDLGAGLLVIASMVFARFKSQGASIKTAQQVLTEYLPILQSAEPTVRASILQVIRERNPKVYDLLVQQKIGLLPPPGPGDQHVDPAR